jgi:tRNA A37 methylthiotransferase MiaB
MKKVYLETFGCQMNVSDSERIATRLAADGFEITPMKRRRTSFCEYLFGSRESRA